jgi:hypothetical protein
MQEVFSTSPPWFTCQVRLLGPTGHLEPPTPSRPRQEPSRGLEGAGDLAVSARAHRLPGLLLGVSRSTSQNGMTGSYRNA